MNKNRLEAFSDGVFAIVITLLIFEIRVPHVAVADLPKALLSMGPKFFSFALSFVIIGVYWVSHHNMIHFIARTDRSAMWLNILVLFTVCIIPLPTALLGDYPKSEMTVIIYGFTLASVNLAGTLFWLYCTKNRRLTVEKLNMKFAKKVAILHASPMILYLIAVFLSFVSVYISYIIYIAVPLFFIIPNPFLSKFMQGALDE